MHRYIEIKQKEIRDKEGINILVGVIVEVFTEHMKSLTVVILAEGMETAVLGALATSGLSV